MYQNIPSEEDFAVSAYIHVYSHCIESDKCDRVQCIQFSLTNRPIREWPTEASKANWILTRNTERPLSKSLQYNKTRRKRFSTSTQVHSSQFASESQNKCTKESTSLRTFQAKSNIKHKLNLFKTLEKKIYFNECRKGEREELGSKANNKSLRYDRWRSYLFTHRQMNLKNDRQDINSLKNKHTINFRTQSYTNTYRYTTLTPNLRSIEFYSIVNINIHITLYT